jgi:hypothetical protein
MIATSGLRKLLREIAPWAAGALCLEIGLRIVWPMQLESAMSDKHLAQNLSKVAPKEAQLRTRIDSLVGDSIRLGERLNTGRSRQIEGSDPAAVLASRVVPLLAGRGWKLDRVKAEASNGSALLDVGASTDFEKTLQGLEDIRSLPYSVKIRKLSLRPNPSGRLTLDLQMSVPARGAP